MNQSKQTTYFDKWFLNITLLLWVPGDGCGSTNLALDNDEEEQKEVVLEEEDKEE